MKDYISVWFVKMVTIVLAICLIAGGSLAEVGRPDFEVAPAQGNYNEILFFNSKIVQAIARATAELEKLNLSLNDYEKVSYSIENEEMVIVAFLSGKRDLPSYEVKLTRPDLNLVSILKGF